MLCRLPSLIRLDLNTPRSSNGVSVADAGAGGSEMAVEFAAHEAAEARMELKRQEQRARQLRRQVEQADGEKRTLQEKVAEAESALRTSVRDRDSLMTYIANVLEKVKQVCFDASLDSFYRIMKCTR